MKWMVDSKGDDRCRGAKFGWTLNRYESLKNACQNASQEWTRRLNRAWRVKRMRRMERSIRSLRSCAITGSEDSSVSLATLSGMLADVSPRTFRFNAAMMIL